MIGAGGPARPRSGAADLQDDDPLGGGRVSQELPDQLIAGAVDGDRRAREKLLALIRPLVLAYCRARLGRRESVMCSADDVAQEVCAAVLSALPAYRLQGLPFRAFVFGIAAHKVADAFRAAGRDHTEPMAEPPDTPDGSDGPEHRLLLAERAERLRGLLAHLSRHQQEVLVLRLAVGLSAEETAQAVRSTPGTVRVAQHRALLRLRQIIQHGESAARVLADRAADDAAPAEEPEDPAGDRAPEGVAVCGAPGSGKPWSGRRRTG
jgi:RNA polymerase sigma-70 factor (ECF subfamily)